jgi:hypothetical protein
MGTSLEFINALVTRSNDRSKRFGEANRPYFMAADGDMYDVEYSLAAATAKTFYNGATDLYTTISWLWVRSEFDAAVEIVYDTANAYGTRYQTYYLEGSGEAGEYGPPLVLANTYAYANFTTNFAAGTLCKPDIVRVKNLDTTNASRIEIAFGE